MDYKQTVIGKHFEEQEEQFEKNLIKIGLKLNTMVKFLRPEPAKRLENWLCKVRPLSCDLDEYIDWSNYDFETTKERWDIIVETMRQELDYIRSQGMFTKEEFKEIVKYFDKLNKWRQNEIN
jgi:hypothetical protein